MFYTLAGVFILVEVVGDFMLNFCLLGIFSVGLDSFDDPTVVFMGD